MPKASWDSLDSDDAARLRDKRLRRQVRFQLYAYSRYYRELLDDIELRAEGFSGLADLDRIPTTSRQTLADRYDDFVLAPSEEGIQRWGSSRQVGRVFFDKLLRGIQFANRELRHEYDPVHVLETTGTTDEPIPIYLTRRDLGVLATQGMRMLETAGARPGEVMLNLLEPISAGGFWPMWSGAVALGIEQVAPGSLEPEFAAALAAKMGAAILAVRAEDALQILEEANSIGLPFLRLIVLAPEPVGGVLRRRVKEAAGAGVRVIGTYGFAEGRTFWAECAAGAEYPDAGYHTSIELELLEAMPTRTLGRSKTATPGEIVYSGLDHHGTALLRYRPGDVAMGGIASGRCPYCGRFADRVIGPVIRSSDLLEFQLAGEDPVALDVANVSAALAHPSLLTWSVEVTKADAETHGPDEVYVFFKPKAEAPPSLVAMELERVFQTELGFSPTQFILSDKADRRVIDLRAERSLSELQPV